MPRAARAVSARIGIPTRVITSASPTETPVTSTTNATIEAMPPSRRYAVSRHVERRKARKRIVAVTP